MGIAWFSGEPEMILVFGNIIYKGRTVDNRLQMMEGGEVFIYYGALGD